MTLRERIKEMPADEMVYVGARTGWIYIARADEIEEKIEPYNAKFYDYYTSKVIPDTEKRIKILQKRIDDMEKAGKNPRRVVREKDMAQSYMDVITAYTENWVDLMDREIGEEYIHKTTPRGTSIIIDGLEAGEFWDLKEINTPKIEKPLNAPDKFHSKYTDAELKIITDVYISHQECARLLNRPINGIREKRMKLKVYPMVRSTKYNTLPWTPEEDVIVMQNKPIKEIASELNRGEEGVRKRRYVLRKQARE